jgi:hypothetical protein
VNLILNKLPIDPVTKKGPEVIHKAHKVNGVGVGWDRAKLLEIAMVPTKALAATDAWSSGVILETSANKTRTY